jgi:hypothetical protein
MGTGPRRTQTAEDAGRVFGVQREKVQQALGVQVAVALQVIVQGSSDQQWHGDFIEAIPASVLWHQRQRVTDVEHPREVFGALQVPRHPI